MIVALLRPGLGVGQLGIAHAGGDAGGQIVELAHLGAGGHQQGLLGTAAGHGTGAQVGDERPGAEDGGRAGLERVDVAQARQHLGHGLDDRARQGGGRGGTGLAGREQQHRHAAGDGDLEPAAGILGEAQGRDDEAAGEADERPGTPSGLAAGHQVEDLKPGIERVAAAETGADMLGGARDAGVERVEVELHGADHVARHQRALVEVDVVERVDDARGVVEVLQQQFAVLAGLEVDHVHGSAGRAVVDLAAPGLEVVAGVLAAKREAAGCTGDDVLDQRPREAAAGHAR